MADDWATEAAKKFNDKYSTERLEEARRLEEGQQRHIHVPLLFAALSKQAQESCAKFNSECGSLILKVEPRTPLSFAINAKLTMDKIKSVIVSVEGDSAITTLDDHDGGVGYPLHVTSEGTLVPLDEGKNETSLGAIVKDTIDRLLF